MGDSFMAQFSRPAHAKALENPGAGYTIDDEGDRYGQGEPGIMPAGMGQEQVFAQECR